MSMLSRSSRLSAPVLIATLAALAMPGSAGAGEPPGGRGSWPWPVLGAVVMPYINGTNRYAAGQHRGLDIAAPVGTPVLSVTSGRVSFSGRLPDGGQAVTITSADGRWLISSLHLSQRAVLRGADVAAGEPIGRVGTSGRRSTERPHLHLGVRRSQPRDYVDPMSLLGAPRLAEPPAATALPRRHLLERPTRRSPDVHAQQPGDAPPATRHGDGAKRPAAARPAGNHAREGRAAGSTGRAAPPPIEMEPTKSVSVGRTSRNDLVPHAEAPVKVPAGPRGQHHRMLLFAIAAVCLVALVLRRRPQQAAPTNAPETDTQAAHVIELQRHRRSA